MRKFLMIVMILTFILATGCDQQLPPEPKTDPPKTTQVDPPEKKPVENKIEKPEEPKHSNPGERVQTVEIKVYYPDESGTKLIPVQKKIQFVDESEKYSAALSELIQKPKDKNLTTVFPSHAKIKSVTREGDTAVVNFDGSILKGFVGGSTGEEFLVNSVVDTLTEFGEIKQVQFLIDGKKIETLSGHMDLSEPIKRTN